MKKRRKSKKKKSIAKRVVVVLLIAIVALAALLYYYLLGFKKSMGNGLAPIKAKETVSGEPVNILLMGVDIGNPKNKSEPKRTDTIMIVNYNPKSEKMKVVSIPRDTRVTIDGRHQKINAAHAIGGPEYLIKAVQNLLGIDVNYYAKVDYKGFRSIIDSIGGIDMDIKNNMNYDDSSQNLHIHFKKGTSVHLDGEKAEEFFRWRKNNDGTGFAEGDLGRINNQHMLIDRVIDKFKNPGIITKIPSLMGTLPKYIETNMDPEDIIKYAYSFSTIEKNNISMETIKGSGKYIGGISYFIYSQRQNRNLINQLRNMGPSLDGEDSFNRQTSGVKIFNGTRINGLAARLSDKIRQKGYTNITTGNGNKRNESKIRVSGKISQSTKNVLKRDFGINNLENVDTNSDRINIEIFLGKNFKE